MNLTQVTDHVTQRYLEECLAPGGGLRTAMQDAKLPAALFESAGQRLLPRPLFVPEAEMRRFADDVIALFHLITALPQRLFGGDFDRFCAELRIDPRRAALMRSLGEATPPLYGRADMYHDGRRFKLLEFNIASELGGVDRAGRIPAALLGVDTFGAFASRHGLVYTDTGRQVAAVLRRAGEIVASGREPAVALLDGPGGMTNYGVYWRSFQELMGELGLDFHVGEVSDVRDREGKLFLRTTPIDVILRTFSVDEICAEPDGHALVEPIFRAHRAGSVVLWTPMASSLYGNKGCLALLSDPRWHSHFTAEELALVDRVLPWTRSLGGTSVEEDQLLRECRERREELILKPNANYGGSGIIAGWETSNEAWRRALKEGAVTGCVVQERVIPRPEPVVDPQTRQVNDWWAAWGLFVTPDGYAGAYARALPARASAVIGVGANAGTRTSGVFLTGNGPGASE